MDKHPQALLIDPLYNYLINLRNSGVQLFVHLTISGIGGLAVGVRRDGRPLVLEANAPSCEEALAALTQVIELTGKPERIRLRVDPIVRIRDAAGTVFSSLKFLPLIVRKASEHGISHFSFSFLEKGMHKKVDQRFASLGCEIFPPSMEEREKATAWLLDIARKYSVQIQACCVPGFPEMRCIDGYALEQMHDQKLITDKTEPRKRGKCGCTASVDIGGWPPKKCYTGCDYCYANTCYTL